MTEPERPVPDEPIQDPPEGPPETKLAARGRALRIETAIAGGPSPKAPA